MKSKVKLVWVESLPANNNSNWNEVIDQLKKRPGQWALVKTYKSKPSCYSTAFALRKIKGVEAVGRGNKLYARFTKSKSGQ